MNMFSIRSEWLKTWKRPMTQWVISILLVIVFIRPPLMAALSRSLVIDTSQGLQIWAGGLNEEALKAGERIREQMTMPGAITVALGTATSLGRVLLIVAGAATAGNEFSWGTARHLVGRTRDRISFVNSKLIVLAGLILLLVTASLIVGTISGSLITPIYGSGFTWGFLTADLFLRLPLALLFATLSVLPYALLAFTLSLITRSTVVGVSIGLLTLIIGEPILAAILGSMSEPWNILVNFIPFTTVRVLGTWMDTLIGGPAPDNVFRAVIVLVGYSLVLSGVALASFRRRELTA